MRIPRKLAEAAPRQTTAGRSSAGPRRRGSASAQLNLTLAEVLERFDAGPDSGVFTDGSAQPNPGPGGWGAVYVVDGELHAQRHGHEPRTTNNRMELVALINGYQMVPPGVGAEVFTDSELCYKTMTQWAAGWQARGWKKKGGPIKNLELVQELYALVQARPELRLRWIKAHDGSRWNEYADSLSTAYARDRL
ncbi:MAG: ribonuclease HI [Deltaproteobacteria bacterium]|nr:ribonuclease HI [Deltaproteobacteria bacterium]